MSLKKTAPTICSGLSSQTGRRECWLSTMVLSTSSSEAAAETETISRRGFMISRTERSSRSSTRWIMSSCSLGRFPAKRLELTMSLSSSAEWPPPRWPAFTPSRRVMPRADPSITVTKTDVNAVEQHERRGDDYGQAVGFVDGEILGHHFADHDVAVGHHGEGQHEADGVQNGGGSRGEDGVEERHEAARRACLRRPSRARGWRE